MGTCISIAKCLRVEGADSTELIETPYPVIFKLRDLVNVEELGGTMRRCVALQSRPESLVSEIYWRKRLASVTVTVMNSIRSSVRSSSGKAWFLAASLPMANSSK